MADEGKVGCRGEYHLLSELTQLNRRVTLASEGVDSLPNIHDERGEVPR